MGAIDVLVFSGGIGENSILKRKLIVDYLHGLGFHVDPGRNKLHGSQSDGIISYDKCHPITFVIPTNEELVIAREVMELINK